MAAFVGLILLAVSIPLLLARYELPLGAEAKVWIESTFFDGKDIFAEGFRYAREVAYLQWPALATGVLEELQTGGLSHFVEFAVFVGFYLWKRYNDKTKPAT